MKDKERNTMLLALKIEEKGPKAQPLDSGKGRKGDSALRIPERNTGFLKP